MAHVRNSFTQAARRAVRLGFDAIELHLAHGYLLHSFVSPLSNKRNDEWGGSLEGRMRFPIEVARAVRAVVPSGIPLGARITGTDWRGGRADSRRRRGAEQGAQGRRPRLCRCIVRQHHAGQPVAERAGYNAPIAERVRRETGLPVRVVGMIANAKQADAIVAEGKADMVAMARAFLDDPHWGWHAAEALGAEVARPLQYARSAPELWPGVTLRN